MSLLNRKRLYTREILQDLAPKYVCGRTIDLGAGGAKYRNIILRYASEYVTCDALEGERVDFVEDAHSLSFPDASFDTVVCTMVFEHVVKPWVVAAEIERILRPEGMCIITVPFMFPYHKDPEDYFRYSKAGIVSLFHNTQSIECEGYGGWGSLIESCWRMCFCSPYKVPHGFIRRNLYRIIRIVFETLDRYTPSPKDLYCSVYFVGRKL